jgi:O-methyltransferase
MAENKPADQQSRGNFDGSHVMTRPKSLILWLRNSPQLQSVYRTYAARYIHPWIHRAPYSREAQRAVLRSGDPTRYGAVALAMSRVNLDEIPGAVAELGVYRGDMAVFLQKFCMNRMLYLFDTFGGFPSQDAGQFGTMFSNTSLDYVRRRMAAAPNVVYRKGYFPDTASGLEDEAFAFVSLDADLYKPTLAGLRFFWPQLSPGGYIFLHDYHSHFPIADAVRDFGLRDFVELPDKTGSIVLRKPITA